jgi:integrase
VSLIYESAPLAREPQLREQPPQHQVSKEPSEPTRSKQADHLVEKAALKEFFTWLAWRPSFKSIIHVPDIDYFSLSIKDNATARAAKLREFPSLAQVRVVLAAMPVETVIDRRNRALIAFAILTGMRDTCNRVFIAQACRSEQITASCAAEPDRVDTKFSKSIITYFFPLGNDLQDIVIRWIEELRTEYLFGPNDPIFPKTRVSLGDDKSFRAAGIEAIHWRDASPVRAIFQHAFAKAGVRYFSPHCLRHTLGHLMQSACRTPRQMKAWSQNLGHENIATTLTSYGTIDPYQQGEVIAAISLDPEAQGADLLAKIRALVI